MSKKIKPSQWQVQIRLAHTTWVLGYIKNKKINIFKYSTHGNDWEKCKGFDKAVRKLLKVHGFDPIHDHGRCIPVPETYKDDWL